MAENKNAKTPADGPEYERGFVDGMQRQMQLHVNRVIREEPTAWQLPTPSVVVYLPAGTYSLEKLEGLVQSLKKVANDDVTP